MRYQYGQVIFIFSVALIVEGQLMKVDNYVKKNNLSNVICSEGQLNVTNNFKTVIKCAKICALYSNCLSFFYNGNGICQLHSTIINNTTSCAVLSKTQYYTQKAGTTIKQLSCDVGWLSIGAGCYKITPGGTKQIWINATQVCYSVGGYLVAIETAEENYSLKNYTSGLGSKDYFIGGSDIALEGTFIWEHTGAVVNLPINGSVLFQDWMKPNQPDNGGGSDQDCMVLYGADGHTWNDVSCTFARDFICEKDPS